jgi:hypothetical protein
MSWSFSRPDLANIEKLNPSGILIAGQALRAYRDDAIADRIDSLVGLVGFGNPLVPAQNNNNRVSLDWNDEDSFPQSSSATSSFKASTAAPSTSYDLNETTLVDSYDVRLLIDVPTPYFKNRAVNKIEEECFFFDERPSDDEEDVDSDDDKELNEESSFDEDRYLDLPPSNSTIRRRKAREEEAARLQHQQQQQDSQPKILSRKELARFILPCLLDRYSEPEAVSRRRRRKRSSSDC